MQGNLSFHDVTELVSHHTEKKTPMGWFLAFGARCLGLGIMGIAIAYLVWNGPGVWGLNNPVFWGWAIVNFVFWVGIGHAGTLISAVLFLFRQKWRTSINRAAEAMTLFAVACALVFPTFHVGRVWLVYYLLPIPNQMAMWPNFKSPLLVGRVRGLDLRLRLAALLVRRPDPGPGHAARPRRQDAGRTLRARIMGFFALGWTGSNRHWRHYERAYLLLAGLATPLVLSVHSVVSFDFAVSIVPGWHTTIFPPYFVAGAIFSGFAMVVTLMVVAAQGVQPREPDHARSPREDEHHHPGDGHRRRLRLHHGVLYAWYSGVTSTSSTPSLNRALRAVLVGLLGHDGCNLIFPQLFWVKKFRRSIPIMFAISITTNIGMWFERFVITVTSLHRDFLPSSWDYYSADDLGRAALPGHLRALLYALPLFLRFVPMVAIAEVKGVMPQADPHFYHHSGDGHGTGDGHGAAPELAAIPAGRLRPGRRPRPRRPRPTDDLDSNASLIHARRPPLRRLDDRANQHVGLLAEFSDPGALYDAVKALRERGYSTASTRSARSPSTAWTVRWAWASRRSASWSFAGGCLGAFLGFFLQWWTSAGGQPDWLLTNLQVDYAINISNKPLFAWEVERAHHVRADDPLLGADGDRRHAGAQPAPEALQPALLLEAV